jgi:hypothetical protein
MDLVRDGGDQAAQEVPRGATRHLLVHLDEGELRRSVDGDEQVELALRSSNLGLLIPEEAAPQFLDDVAPRNGMMPAPDSEMIAPPITE